MYHSFDKDIAVKYGVTEAVLLNHMLYWIEKNEANGTNFHDGSYWTYNSTKAFAEIFPYFSARQISIALKHLRDEGIIKTGNYNKEPWDRTLWYAFTEFGISIMQKCEMEYTEMSNGVCKNVKPIPDIIPDINADYKPDNIIIMGRKSKKFVKPTVEQIQDYCNEKNYDIDAERFFDYYEANGWVQGKQGKPIKDWKAAVRNWNRNNFSSDKRKTEYHTPKPEDYDLSSLFD